MAATQGKHSLSRAQGSRRRAHASTKPAVKTKARKPSIPPQLRYKETKRGKTTKRRYPHRSFYRFEEAKGKPVESIEFFTGSNYHAIDVKFEDKTAFHFIIDPAFTLEADYSDWKTGNWRPIKRWRPIPSEGFV